MHKLSAKEKSKTTYNKHDKIAFDKTHILFFYSFLFDELDLGDFTSSQQRFSGLYSQKDLAKREERKKSLINKIENQLNQKIECKVELHEGEDPDDPPEMRFFLYQPYPHLSIDSLWKNVSIVEENLKRITNQYEPENSIKWGNTLVDVHMALFDPGISICCVDIAFENELSPKDVIMISNLGNFVNQGKRLALLIENADNSKTIKSLAKFFYDEVSNLFNVIRSSHDNFNNLKWLEKGTVSPIASNTHEEFHFQDPYVANLVVTEKKPNDLTQQVLMAILFRDISLLASDLQTDYINKYTESHDGRLVNMYLGQDFFINLCHRSALAILPSDSKICYLKRALIRVLGSIKMRWQSYNVLNTQILHQLRKMEAELEEPPTRELTGAIIDLQKNILNNDLRFLTSLMMQGPVAHSGWFGPLTEVYKKGCKLFRIEETEKAIWNSLEEVNRVHQNFVDIKKFYDLLKFRGKI